MLLLAVTFPVASVLYSTSYITACRFTDDTHSDRDNIVKRTNENSTNLMAKMSSIFQFGLQTFTQFLNLRD
jgi:hypothetical protein